MLNQQIQHLFSLCDTDRHSRSTILVHQQCTGRIPKLRRHLIVNKPDSDWQAGPITAVTGWHKRRSSNSHLDFQLSNSPIDSRAEVSIESWWGTVTVQVKEYESGGFQVMMHHGRLAWLLVVRRKALWFCYAMQICVCIRERNRGLILSLYMIFTYLNGTLGA